jgi:predicted ribosome quality control (RQC) complex YloA/Tae2 family protein
MQPVDFTTLSAICAELKRDWIPARLEQVYQIDRYTLSLALRTIEKRAWLTISWHPQAARICIGNPPPRTPDTFAFSDRLRHQLNGLAVTNLDFVTDWERVIDLQFAKRPDDEPNWHLYVEIIGKYSNVILTDANQKIVTVARQVTADRSSLRTVETGQKYELPPRLLHDVPKVEESLTAWQEKVGLIPGEIRQQLVKSYRGISPHVANLILERSNLRGDLTTDTLTQIDWQNLYQNWQIWLSILNQNKFTFGYTATGYTVLGWSITSRIDNLQQLINNYYLNKLNLEAFKQLKYQLSQKIISFLKKAQQKAAVFQLKLQESNDADIYRQKADLLMAYPYQYRVGMTSIVLPDFMTEQPISIALNPEKNAIQNAQSFYKNHQKLKRARLVVEPLLAEVQDEINYLQQVQTAIDRLETYHTPEDLEALEEIRDELIEQQYLISHYPRQRQTKEESQPYRYLTPSGFELWIGRNNRQNDLLTFKTATDYDLWFHTQEIPGSHLLLRLEPGRVAAEADLQIAADLAAYYSRGRQSEQVPVVYTKPKHIYKPKGAKPGMVIYKQERVIWGRPQEVERRGLHSFAIESDNSSKNPML